MRRVPDFHRRSIQSLLEEFDFRRETSSLSWRAEGTPLPPPFPPVQCIRAANGEDGAKQARATAVHSARCDVPFCKAIAHCSGQPLTATRRAVDCRTLGKLLQKLPRPAPPETWKEFRYVARAIQAYASRTKGTLRWLRNWQTSL